MSSNYASITADKGRGLAIAREYLTAPLFDDSAADAYDAFAAETVRQYDELRRTVRMSVSSADPYDTPEDMFAAVNSGELAVLSTAITGGHPYLSDRVNDIFRAVHDYHGHYSTGRGFDRHGEEAAWTRHSRMYSPLARRAMTAETRGQNSAMVWVLGTFPVQKFTTLPEWVSAS